MFLPSHDWFPAIGIYVDSFIVWFVDYTRWRPASRRVDELEKVASFMWLEIKKSTGFPIISRICRKLWS